jgi:hypothetical protein
MPPEKWEGFDREGPVPFVPDLCVEVLLDRKSLRANVKSGVWAAS